MHASFGVTFREADSRNVAKLLQLPRVFDVCVLDGEHSAEAATAELRRLRGRCRHFVLHDVVNTRYVDYEYRLLWQALKAAYHGGSEECTMQAPGTRSAFGFGILHGSIV